MRVIYWLNSLQESSCPTQAIVCIWLFSVQHTPQQLLQSYLIVSSSPYITYAGMIQRWPSPKRQKQIDHTASFFEEMLPLEPLETQRPNNSCCSTSLTYVVRQKEKGPRTSLADPSRENQSQKWGVDWERRVNSANSYKNFLYYKWV